ncbi:uncharacterized protein LOC111303801 [Durio zibethinus]|uniref:Uncharacterized protein LOC111303801 n=1 Tax=Durio zibethinus TaxID=66656 RepID=A0A6P5ZT10_DURZI|nr:uncharacterized protein LOC111303801 [Durio zibethinus]
MECKFSNHREASVRVTKFDGEVVPKNNQFQYLGSIIQSDTKIEMDVKHRIQAEWFQYLGSIILSDTKIEMDVKHRIQARWVRWRSAFGVLCDRNMSLKLKAKLYKITISYALVRRIKSLNLGEIKIARGRPQKTWKRIIKNDMMIKELDENSASEYEI